MKRKHRLKQYFLKHPQMDFELQCVLGGCYYGAADAGDVLATAEQIRAGDCESWYQAWQATADRVAGIADECRKAGRPISARRAYLRAANYYAVAIAMIDGTRDPARREPTWTRHIDCWNTFCRLLNPAADLVEIPYENTSLPGYFFKPSNGTGPFSTLIFNNGSDGPTSALWGAGVAGALERGYAALVFDGPGQNAMLWKKQIPFRHDWEKVITPVVDFLITRKDVRRDRIALSGISQGGYWILRALAFEHRIVAGVADPGVMDVSTALMSRLPVKLKTLLETGDEKKFNRYMAMGIRWGGATARQEVQWRMKPYGVTSYYQWFKTAQRYHLRDVIGQITCPIFLADPEDEVFWPGQPQEVFNALKCPKTIVRFTAAEGANGHCQPKARGLYDQRMFDWLESVMPA